LFLGGGYLDVLVNGNHLVIFDKERRCLRMTYAIARGWESLVQTSLRGFSKELVLTSSSDKTRYATGLEKFALPLSVPDMGINAEQLKSKGDTSGYFSFNRNNKTIDSTILWRLSMDFDKLKVDNFFGEDVFTIDSEGCLTGQYTSGGFSPLIDTHPLIGPELSRQLHYLRNHYINYKNNVDQEI
jgi:hypothetical protein